MSYGAISKPAVRALSRGARMAGCWMNTGEGGCRPITWRGRPTSSSRSARRNSACATPTGNLDDDRLREVAAHTQVKMFEIKLAQGAKPGKGGILPAAKITDEIAEIRGSQGQDGISPTATGRPRNNASFWT
jgi:glutamate synthase domain-containing protein 2